MAEPAREVVVVDYGLGNLFSVCRALEACGGAPRLSSRPEEAAAAPRLVLPGVGAFGDGMAGLRRAGLVEPLREFARTGRPLVGLCLGMQLLFSESSEFGAHEGLGLIPGRVERLEARDAGGAPLKVPHVGWNALEPGPRGWEGSLLEGLPPGERVYFVHSYAPQPQDPAHALALCRYGRPFAAAARKDNLTGCQFHPEKSGPAGLAILRRFLRA